MKQITEEEIEKFLKSVADDVGPKIRDSVFCVIALHAGRTDIALALQIGLAVLMSKPLLVVSARGVPIPPQLRLIAAEIVEGDDLKGAELRERVKEAVARMVANVEGR